jgi:hypothetical protein
MSTRNLADALSKATTVAYGVTRLGAGAADAAQGNHAHTKADVGLGNVENLKVNLAATAAPTVNDDSGDGYAVGSRWLDVTNDKEYVALDVAAGAAVWVETTATGGGGSLTIEEVDGSPTHAAPTKLVFPNGTLGLVGAVMTYTPSGGGGGALEAIYDSGELGSAVADIDITGIPTDGTYVGLLLDWAIRSARAANTQDDVYCRTNGDTGSNYDYAGNFVPTTGSPANLTGGGGNGFFLGGATAATATAGAFGGGAVRLPGYANTNHHKIATAQSMTSHKGDAALAFFINNSWRSTAAINRLTVRCANGNIAAGSRVTLYGLKPS